MFSRLKRLMQSSRRLITNQLRDIQKSDRHGGLHFDLNKVHFNISPEALNKFLNDISNDSKSTASCVWIHMPMQLGILFPVLKDNGFEFHHAEGLTCSVVKWLKDIPSKIPAFCTHQIGISAVVCREKEKLLLLVKEKNSVYKQWKFPTGLANLGENIGDAAVREVLEETGMHTKFLSLISIWQRHNFPSSFGRSDLLALCRLAVADGSKLDFTPCNEEIEECSWMTPESLLSSADKIESQFLRMALRLISHCLETGSWSRHEMTCQPIPSLHSSARYNLYLTGDSWKVT